MNQVTCLRDRVFLLVYLFLESQHLEVSDSEFFWEVLEFHILLFSIPSINDNELLSVPGPHKCSKPCNLSLSLEPSELIKHNPRAVPLLLRWKRWKSYDWLITHAGRIIFFVPYTAFKPFSCRQLTVAVFLTNLLNTLHPSISMQVLHTVH